MEEDQSKNEVDEAASWGDGPKLFKDLREVRVVVNFCATSSFFAVNLLL